MILGLGGCEVGGHRAPVLEHEMVRRSGSCCGHHGLRPWES